MNQQAGVSYELPRDEDEILEIFGRYDFRDPLGHPLLMCREFRLLVKSYCLEAKDKSKDGREQRQQAQPGS